MKKAKTSVSGNEREKSVVNKISRTTFKYQLSDMKNATGPVHFVRHKYVTWLVGGLKLITVADWW